MYQIILSNNAVKLNRKITDKVARRELEKIDKYFEDEIEKTNEKLNVVRKQLLDFKSNVKIGDIQIDNNTPEGVDPLEFEITEEIYNNQLFNIEDRIDDLATQIESLESQKKTNQDNIRKNIQIYYNIEIDNNGSTFQKKVDFNDLIGSKKNEVVDENNEVVDEVEDFSKENSKVLFNDKSKVTVDEVLDNIINNFNDLSPIGKELVTKAKNLKNKTGANIKFVKESVLETENTVMQIDAKTNTIEISKERLAKVNSKIAVESFLHELGHAQSLQALINPVTFEEKQFAELISKMFKWYSNLSNGSESYGFTNEAEFVSELYTNKAFQDEIRALDVEENTSYWKQFIDAVRRLFGLAKSKQSDLLIEQIITFVESDRTNYTGIGNRRVVFAKRIEDDSQYSSLESKLDNFIVDAKKNVQAGQERTIKSNLSS